MVKQLNQNVCNDIREVWTRKCPQCKEVIVHKNENSRNECELRRNVCLKCSGMNKSKTIDKFIKQSVKLHGSKYDYSKSVYINNRTDIEIICPVHDVFWQRPDLHSSAGKGCPQCGEIERRKNCKLTQKEFLKSAKEIHGDKYDYSLTTYVHNNEKIKIICKEHGIFEQTPHNHARKHRSQGCPKCNLSKGESRIMTWLDKNKIKYEYQKRFDDLKAPIRGWLRFDFYIPSKNLLIEFDGQQHFKSGITFNNHKTTDKEFRRCVKLDKIKEKYAVSRRIKLLRIPYWELKTLNRTLERI